MADGDPATSSADTAFTWSVHPARERPLRAVLVSAVVVAMGWFVLVESGLLMAGMGAMLVLVLVLQRFFFPSTYRIDEEGISEFGVWGQRTLRWQDVRSAQIGSRAALLSHVANRKARSGARDIHVLFGRHRERITAELRARLPETLPDATETTTDTANFPQKD